MGLKPIFYLLNLMMRFCHNSIFLSDKGITLHHSSPCPSIYYRKILLRNQQTSILRNCLLSDLVTRFKIILTKMKRNRLAFNQWFRFYPIFIIVYHYVTKFFVFVCPFVVRFFASKLCIRFDSYPRPVLAFGYCRWLCVCVCPSITSLSAQ